MHTRRLDNNSESDGVTRRTFLGTTMGGGAALLTGGLASLFTSSTAKAVFADDAPWIEASILKLHRLIANGVITSRKLTQSYLKRIAELNPLLHAVIETNCDALEIAEKRDNERLAGHVRGPLHGIPVLVKDNIATHDSMQTTAGSLALLYSEVPSDSVVVQRLRAAGAVIIGKANLSEWANFRGFAPFNGWSARGEFTRNPYKLGFDPCGSSSGSASATAANLCATSVGTETDGSIVCPSGNNLVVGLKPTVGLISGEGIIPIAHSQDTAGPMCRTVTDAAIMLGVMQSPFGDVADRPLPSDYTKFLRRGALKGARIGIDRRYFTANYGGETDLVRVARQGLDAMRSLGATLVDTDTGDTFQDDFKFYNDEFTVLLFEFKVQIAQYLATLKETSQRTLADLIAFNIAHCSTELKYYGQEIFHLAQDTSGNLRDPVYLNARNANLDFARNGINLALQRGNLDAIVPPTYSYASSLAAVAGYPDISVPVGLTRTGKPAGLWMYSGYLQEPKLLAFAYDLEQEIRPRTVPKFLGHVPPEPPNAGICEGPSGAAAISSAQPAPARTGRLSYHLGTGKLFPQ
ncbi:MAG: amidase [Chthoniobacterales bacterium]|nr:amidase [Chthoniobacterales bacterium]